VSGDDRIKRRSYTHLRHVLPLCTPAPSGAKPFAVLSARSARPDKARRTWRAPNSINCFEDTRRSRERFASRSDERLLIFPIYASIYVYNSRALLYSFIYSGICRTVYMVANVLHAFGRYHREQMSPSPLFSCLSGAAGSSIVETTRKYLRAVSFLSQKPQRFSIVIRECFGRAVVTSRRKKKCGNTFRISAGDSSEMAVFM